MTMFMIQGWCRRTWVFFCFTVLLVGTVPSGIAAADPVALVVGHPRLLFGMEDLEMLRTRAVDEEPDELGLSGKALWQSVLDAAEAAVGKPVAAEFEEYAARGTATRWAPLAVAYAVTEDGRYLEQMRSDLATVLSWDTWGPVGQFSVYTITIGVALTLDVAWSELPEQERKAASEALVERGLLPLYEAGKGLRFAEPNSNGRVFFYSALGLGAMVLLGEADYPDAEQWVAEVAEAMETIFDRSDPDGSWAEGIGYGTAAFDEMWGLALLDALRRVRGVDLFAHQFMHNLPHFALHTMRPGGRGGVGFNDTWQQNGFHLVALRAAWEYATAQWAWYLKTTGWKAGAGPVSAVNAFLNHRPVAGPASPQGVMPLSRHFRKVGWVTCRTAWDDPDAVLFAMQTTPIGHYHEHNAMNHFEIHGFGSRLATSPGYHHGRSWRASYGHNLLWVDGKAQNNAMIGERGGDIRQFVGAPFFDYVLGEAHPYGTPEEPLVESWHRRVVFAKPDYLVIFDDVRATEDTPREYKWILNVTCAHAIAQTGQFQVEGDTVVALPDLDPTGQLSGKVLLPPDMTAESAMWDETRFSETYGPYYAVTPAVKRANEQFLVVLYPQPRGADAPEISGFDTDVGQGFEVAVPGGRNLHLYRLGEGNVSGQGLETDGVSCMVGLDTNGHMISYALCEGQRLVREGQLLLGCDQAVTAAFSRWQSYARTSDRFPAKTVSPDELYGVVWLAEPGQLEFFTGSAPRSLLLNGRDLEGVAFDQESGLVSLGLSAGQHEILVQLQRPVWGVADQ